MASRKTVAASTPASPKAARPRAAKAAAPVAPAPAETARQAKTKPGVAAKKPAVGRSKLVRDSFTMPQTDFALVAQLKARALDFKRPTKKSELLRAGLQVLNQLDNKSLQAALEALAPLKTGRPKKSA
jgi:hypothetical protein